MSNYEIENKTLHIITWTRFPIETIFFNILVVPLNIERFVHFMFKLWIDSEYYF
jgi:hypothetical protein